MKRINGTWLELHHNGIPEGKYFNEAMHNFTDQQWKEKVKEFASLKMKYIVIMSTAYSDSKNVEPVAFYDSKHYKKSTLLKAKDPLEAILQEADRQDMKVFMSTGFYAPWDLPSDNMAKEDTYKKAFIGMEELFELYGHHQSFYGWYLPDESEIHKYFDEDCITYVNRFAAFAHKLNKEHKILIAPYGTCKLVADDYYVSQLKRMDVDFIAYQDEVGVKKTDENHTATFYKNLYEAHKKANRSKLWADMEVFTFEGEVYKSALLPANINRLKKQMEAISPYVEEILIFEYQGMFNMPNSKAFCGHEDSVKYYNDYLELLKTIN